MVATRRPPWMVGAFRLAMPSSVFGLNVVCWGFLLYGVSQQATPQRKIDAANSSSRTIWRMLRFTVIA
jgi:hypothetical protein